MQLTYPVTMNGSLVGQVSDNCLNEINSFIANEAIGFGAAVVRDVTSNATLKNIKNMSGAVSASAAGLWVGIALRNDIPQVGSVVQSNANAGTPVVDTWMNNDTYPIGAIVPVMRYGRVEILCTTIVGTPTIGTAQAYFVYATKTYTISNAVVASAQAVGYLVNSDASGSYTAGKLYSLQINNMLT